MEHQGKSYDQTGAGIVSISGLFVVPEWARVFQEIGGDDSWGTLRHEERREEHRQTRTGTDRRGADSEAWRVPEPQDISAFRTDL